MRAVPIAVWFRTRGRAYALAVVAVAVASIATAVLRDVLAPSVSLLFFPAILLPAIYGGYGPALLSTVLSTASLAYFFIRPLYSFQIGLDDGIRLFVFAAVACATSWLSAARRRAEEAQRRSLAELHSVVTVLQRVSDWPLVIGPDTGVSVRWMLEHAATIAGARAAAVAWAADEEPGVYSASTTEPDVVLKDGASTLDEWPGEPPPAAIVRRLGDPRPVSASFRVEQVAGRIFFSGVDAGAADLMHVVTVVAHEVGNSLGQLYLTDRVRELGIREDRLRFSRDLHDGVLQSLMAIRLELQDIAADARPEKADRLFALERALAIEQRELRLFIEGLRPEVSAPAHMGPIAIRLEEMRARLTEERRIPMTLRVEPIDLTLPQAIEQAVRLMIHEGVSNAVRHALPSRVSIEVEAKAAGLKVVIGDDGRGFSFRGRFEHGDLVRLNIGPVSLRERVAALSGQLSVESTPTGSQVEFVIPLT